jgi:pimeloyl-ACP methyl ester carboxylesterase
MTIRKTVDTISGTKSQTVVLVHGIWMTGLEMSWLARQLRKAGYDVRRFSYPSIRGELRDNVERLKRFVDSLSGDRVHFVCHSMGGLLVHEFFRQYPEQRPGRIVALGTPFNGSWTARRVRELRLPRWTLGKTLLSLLSRENVNWDGSCSLGIIAGTYSLGIGTVLGKIPSGSDGTVTVEETKLSGATAHITAPLNHFGLLISPAVFRQVDCFLRQGHFQ